MSYEYRVLWRREHDRTLRRRLYQTRKGAEDFAGYLEGAGDPEWGMDGILADNLARVGEVTEVRAERREVGEWGPVAEEML